MAVSGVNRRTMRLFLSAIILGILSLAAPWWTFIMLIDGNLVSSFNLFLFGIAKTGFLRANLSFEWWSYLTCAIIAFGTCLGLIGYRSLVLGKKNWTKLVAADIAFMISGCLIYVINLALTLAVPLTDLNEMWMTAPTQSFSSIAIALRYVVGIRMVNMGGTVVVFEFLSIGFVLAVISFVLLIIVYRLSRVQLQIRNSNSHVVQAPDLLYRTSPRTCLDFLSSNSKREKILEFLFLLTG
jgi:hypothetical protein